ncbi:MAG: hypothetical protein ACYC91_18420 [Solirubrobacteraceae bacterium]
MSDVRDLLREVVCVLERPGDGVADVFVVVFGHEDHVVLTAKFHAFSRFLRPSRSAGTISNSTTLEDRRTSAGPR